MTIAVEQSFSGTTSASATSHSISVSGITAGNLLVWIISHDGDVDTYTPPTGWTLLETWAASGNAVSMAVYYKTAVTADESATSYTISGPREGWASALYELSGWNETTPFEADPLTRTQATGASGSRTQTSANYDADGIQIAGCYVDADETPISDDSTNTWTQVFSGTSGGGNNAVTFFSGYRLGITTTAAAFSWASSDQYGVYILYINGSAGGTQTNQTVTGSLTGAGALTGKAFKELAGSITTAGANIRKAIVSRLGSITAAGANIRETAKTLLASITASGAITSTKVVMQAVTGAITAAGLLVRDIGKTVTGALDGMVSSLTKQAKVTREGNLTGTGSIIKAISKKFQNWPNVLPVSPHFSGYPTNRTVAHEDFSDASLWSLGTGYSISDGQLIWSGASPSTAICDGDGYNTIQGRTYECTVVCDEWAGTSEAGIYIGSLWGGSISGTGSFTFRQTQPTISSGTPYILSYSTHTYKLSHFSIREIDNASLIRDVLKRIAASITTTGAVSSTKVLLRAIAGSITATGTVAKRTGKRLAGTVTAAGSLVKRISAFVSGVITAVGAGVGEKQGAAPSTKLVLFRGAIFRDTDTKLVLFRGRIYKGTATTQGGTTFEQAVAGSITAVGAIATILGKLLQGTITAAGSLVRATAKSVAGSVTATGALIKRAAKELSGVLTASGTLNTIKVFLQALAGSIAASGVLATATAYLRTVAGSITGSGTIATTKVVLQAIAGSITATGSLIKRTATSVLGQLQPRGISFLSEEQMADHSFDNASQWNAGLGWTVTGGQAVASAANTQILNNTGITFPEGTVCRVETVIDEWTSATFAYALVSGTAVLPITVINGVGTFTQYHTVGSFPTPNNGLSTIAGNFKVGSFSVKKATPLQKLVYKATSGTMSMAGIVDNIKVLLQTVAGSITAAGDTVKQALKLVTGWLPVQTAGGTGQDDHLRNADNWILGTGVTLDTQAETVSWDGTAALAPFRPTPEINLPDGDYVATCDIDVYNSGTLEFWTGGTGNSFLPWPQAVGSYRVEFTNSGDSTPVWYGWMTGGGTFDGTVSNLHVYERLGKHLYRDVATDKTGLLTASGKLTKNPFKLFTGSITGSGALTAIQGLLQLCTGTIAATGALIKHAAVTRSGSITGSGILNAATTFANVIAGQIAAAGNLVKQTAKTVTGSITKSGFLDASKIIGVIQKTVTGAITSTGALIKRTTVLRTGVITATGVAIKRAFKTFVAEIEMFSGTATEELLYDPECTDDTKWGNKGWVVSGKLDINEDYGRAYVEYSDAVYADFDEHLVVGAYYKWEIDLVESGHGGTGTEADGLEGGSVWIGTERLLRINGNTTQVGLHEGIVQMPSVAQLEVRAGTYPLFPPVPSENDGNGSFVIERVSFKQLNHIQVLVYKILRGSSAASGQALTALGKLLTGAITPTGNIVKRISKKLAGSIISVGALIANFISSIFLENVYNTMTIDDTEQKMTIGYPERTMTIVEIHQASIVYEERTMTIQYSYTTRDE